MQPCGAALPESCSCNSEHALQPEDGGPLPGTLPDPRGWGPGRPPPSSGIWRAMTWQPLRWGAAPAPRGGPWGGRKSGSLQKWGIRAALFPARLSPRRPRRLPKASAAPCCSCGAAGQPPPPPSFGGPERSCGSPAGWVPSFHQHPPKMPPECPPGPCGASSHPPPLTPSLTLQPPHGRAPHLRHCPRRAWRGPFHRTQG